MAKRRSRRTSFVPRIVLGTACAAGVVPVSVAACGRPVVLEGSSETTGAGPGGAIFTVAAVAFGGFPTSGPSGGAAGAGGMGGAAGSGTGGGATGGGATDGGSPDAFFTVAQMGFVVPASEPVLPPERSPRTRKRRSSGRRRRG